MQIKAAQSLTDEHRAELRKAGFAKLHARLTPGRSGVWTYAFAAYDPDPLAFGRTSTPSHNGNMCTAVIPQPPAPPQPLLLRMSLLAVGLWARLRNWYGIVAFLVFRLIHRRALATECKAVPALTGGPDLLGWRRPVVEGMAFVASAGEVSIVPQAVPSTAGEVGCLSARELARRRLAFKYPTTIIRIDGRGGWVVSTAGNLARFFGVRA